MQESEIRSEFQPYKHPYWGIVGLYPANGEGKDTYTCDNYHLFNALYERVLKSWGYSLTKSEIAQELDFSNACEKELGLFARFPSRMGDDISQDEIYGICFTSVTDANWVSEYGSTNYWCYWLANPNHFHWDYFFARYPSFVAYVKAAAGRRIWFSQFVWCAGFLASALTSHNETTGKILSYLQIPIMEKYFFPKIAIEFWKIIMKLRYPGGIKEIMNLYFRPDNPFIQTARSDFN